MTREFLRLFIAIKLDDQAIIDKITRLQHDLLTAKLRAKYVEPENLHITLKFIGEVTPEVAERIAKSLREIQGNQFEIEFYGIGAFPSLSRPRVLWIGVRNGASQLETLAESIEATLSRKVRIKRSEKSFHPHLTIARVKGRLTLDAKKILEAHREDIFGQIKAREFLLMKSTLTPRGPIYNVVEKYELI